MRWVELIDTKRSEEPNVRRGGPLAAAWRGLARGDAVSKLKLEIPPPLASSSLSLSRLLGGAAGAVEDGDGDGDGDDGSGDAAGAKRDAEGNGAASGKSEEDTPPPMPAPAPTPALALAPAHSSATFPNLGHNYNVLRRAVQAQLAAGHPEPAKAMYVDALAGCYHDARPNHTHRAEVGGSIGVLFRSQSTADPEHK